jgi:hypothetical protein
LQTTTNYGLKKPDGTDNYDKANDNSNMDAIDAAMKANADAAAAAKSTANDAIPATQKGAANGVATLDASGTIPDSQIPAAITRDTELSAHTTATTAHGSTSAATASAIMQRDAAGRAKVAAPSAADDIARLDSITAAQAGAVDLTTAQTIGGAKTFSSPMQVGGPQVGTSVGNLSETFKTIASASGSNGMYLVQRIYRDTAGSDWTGVSFEILGRVDVTDKQKIRFEPDGSIKLVPAGSAKVYTPNNVLDGGTGNMQLAAQAWFRLAAPNGSHPYKYLRSDSDSFQVLNSAFDTVLFSMNDSGAATFADSIYTNGTSLQIVPTAANQDALLLIESTNAASTVYRRKQIIASANDTYSGNGWLFRSVRPSDGAISDVSLDGLMGGKIAGAISGGFKIQSGNVAMASSNNAWTAQSVTFPTAFTSAPVVLLEVVQTSGHRIIHYVSPPTTSGFVINLYDMDGAITSAALSVNWKAIGA